jgi:hypothetical protein
VREEEGVPTRFKNPIELPTAVFDGLETVQESRETSMLDPLEVQEIANRLGYPEVALWVGEHQHEYLEGISCGFVVAEQEEPIPFFARQTATSGL